MLAAVLLLFIADEPRQLKYVFKVGDEVKYINTNLRTTAYKKAGKKLEVSLEQKSANLWKVLSVSPDGSAEVSQTITRLRVTQKGGPLGVQMIVANAVKQLWQIVHSELGPESDFTRVVELPERWAGVEVRSDAS